MFRRALLGTGAAGTCLLSASLFSWGGSDKPKLPQLPQLRKDRKYVLYFFPARAKAELARLIFAKAGVEYEDHRIPWGELKGYKPRLPFGQVPALEVDGKVLAERFAIARFLANEFNLAGKDNLEKGECDMIVDVIRDLHEGILDSMHETDPDRLEEMESKYIDETLPLRLTQLEKLIKPSGVFVGDSITWADLWWYDFCVWLERIDQVEKIPPKLLALREKVGADPPIAKWVEERPKTDV